MNDADMQAAELTRQGNLHAKLKKKGICLHGRRQGPGDPINEDGESTCLECGKSSTWWDLDQDALDYL